MKIGYVINEKYKETQILICSDTMNMKVKEIGESISELLSESIMAYSQDKVIKISADSVVRIYSQSGKVYAQTSDDTYVLHYRLYEAEETFGTQFIRISNSEIVNKHKIMRLDTTITGTIKIYMQGDIDSFVSRRFVSKIKKTLDI